MYISIPNNRMIVSNDSGTVPSVEEVRVAGVALNTTDNLLYFISSLGELESHVISTALIKELIGVNAGLTGRMQYLEIDGGIGTIVRMNGIGRIVAAGDILRLPYGINTQVLFVSSNDTVMVKDALEPAHFENAEVMRWSAPLEELDNPSFLSTLMETVTFGDIDTSPESGGNYVAPSINRIVIFGDGVLYDTFSGTGEQDAMDSFYRKGLMMNAFNRAGENYTIADMRNNIDAVIAEFIDNADNTVFFLHGSTVDVGMFPDNADTLDEGLREVAQKIKDAGFMLAMSDITHLKHPAVFDSMLYNSNVVNPIINEFADVSVQLNKLSIDNRGLWFSMDGVTPSRIGKLLNIEHMAGRISPHVRNVPLSPEESLKDVLLSFGAKDVMKGGLNKASNRSGIPLYNTDYTRVPDATMSYANASTFGTKGRGNTDDPTYDAIDIYNHVGLTQYAYRGKNSSPIIILFNDAKLDPDTMYRVRVTGSRNTNTSRRLADVTVAVEMPIILDATANPAAVCEVVVKGIDLTVKGIEVNTREDADYAHLSMIQVTRVDNDVSNLN